ncbi:hypothetical protein CEXT_755341 [Caerostris extrusa]|uniref:Uncharacterized protein n=1 Tax=Caerostris extrusa TaxID=172846 RepID=A0AAV4PVK3_CAEEX|nr:hypothetical protein CEXT_755341 [Caerostris extrusa]
MLDKSFHINDRNGINKYIDISDIAISSRRRKNCETDSLDSTHRKLPLIVTIYVQYTRPVVCSLSNDESVTSLAFCQE